MSLLKKNVIVVTGVLISNLLAFAFHFIAGRILGPDAYGEFGAMLALLMIIGLPIGALNSTVTKFTSRVNSNKPEVIRKLKSKFQFDAILASGIIIISILIFRKAMSSFLNLESSYMLLVIAGTGLVSLLLGINRGVVLGVQNYNQYSRSLIIESVVRLLALFALIYLGLEASGAIGAFSIAYLTAFLILEYHHKLTFKEKKKSNIRRKELYKFFGVMLAVQIMIQGTINIPTLYIKHEYSSIFTGYWNAALTVSRTILFFTTAVTMVLFTETAGTQSPDSRKKNFQLSSFLVFAGAGALAVIFYFFPEFFLKLLFGSEYIGAAAILRWMGFAMLGISLINLWAKYYLAKMK